MLRLGSQLYSLAENNCNRTRFMTEQLNVNRFKQNLQKIMLNVSLPVRLGA